MRHSRENQINDEVRRQWVDNDEGLYRECAAGMRSERISKREWVKRNRGMIDVVIGNVVGGERQAHYLAYERRGQ